MVAAKTAPSFCKFGQCVVVFHATPRDFHRILEIGIVRSWPKSAIGRYRRIKPIANADIHARQHVLEGSLRVQLKLI